MSKKLKAEIEATKVELACLKSEINRIHGWFRLPHQHADPLAQLAEIADFRDQTGYPNIPVKISGTKPDGTRYAATVYPQELIYDTTTEEWQLKCGTYAEGKTTLIPLSEIDRWF